MSSSSGSENLSDAESADLTARVEQFRAAWTPDGSTDLSPALPPPGSRHRLAALIQIVLADMERRAAARLPFRAERYVGMFPDDLTSNTVPAELLVAEYRLRHRFTDRPALAEYERWFPDQYPAIAEALAREPLEPSILDATKRASVLPIPPSETRRSGRRSVDQTPVMSGDVLPANTPYHLIRKLGSGAFGEVYEALAPGGIRVAVKRIMRSVDHPSSQSEHEALEAVKQLSHPFLLKTNAYWVLDDRLVIVMELADTSLADRIAFHVAAGRPGIPPEELVPLFEQASEALDYLHSESVSHRDVKPENILIQRGYAKVADFGLVRAHEHTMTAVGNTAGTPAYMAPEMWQQRVSLQSDQYSLAATYVRARLNRFLYQTNILIDMANGHLNGTPDLADLPAAEREVLLKALSKKPDDRYPSCAAFAKALRLAVFPPPEPPPPPRSRSALIPTVAAVVVTATAAVVLALVFSKPTPPPPEREPEKPFVEFTGWDRDPGAPLEIGEKRYPPKFMRKVGDDELTALLIHPTGAENSGHPPPFYMLENKITVRTFAKVWDEVKADTKSDYARLGKRQDTLAPGTWAKLTKEYDPNAPVLGVTFPEALIVAKRLGGELPDLAQWKKATGEMERERPPWPSEKGVVLAKEEGNELALRLPTPAQVTFGNRDLSVWKVRQLLTNGREWLGQNSTQPTRIALSSSLTTTASAMFVGESFDSENVLGFSDINGWLLETEINDCAKLIGFRIVLEPR